MTQKKKDTVKRPVGISRRDFFGGTLVGVGAALLAPSAPLMANNKKPIVKSNDPWTGYGGVGDYAISNGNVASVRDAAHLIRDGYSEQLLEKSIDADEEYDMVILGGGFSGIGAAYEFHKKYGDSKTCLILDNHPVFGGEAKQNEFEVDGYRLYGPQASNDFAAPREDSTSLMAEIYKDVGLPFQYDFVEPDPRNSKIRTPLDNFFGIYWAEEKTDMGYFAGEKADNPWVLNPRDNDFADMPWSARVKADMKRAFRERKKYYTGDDVDQWLDTMSYKDYLEKIAGFGPEVAKFFDPLIAISMGGVSCDVYSAYAAKDLNLPGMQVYNRTDGRTVVAHSFPGGNAGIIRHMVNYLIPGSITGGGTFEEILTNPINFEALDSAESSMKMRLNATVLDVQHEGPAEEADHVRVSYYKNGKVHRVKAKTVVVGIGGWVARNIIKDMPAAIEEAYQSFYHAPVLVVNVALRQWQFLEKIGIASGRWAEGFGNFFSIRRPMVTGDRTQPYDPEKPIVMTFYVPFNYPGYSVQEQGALGRADLLSKSYADYEMEILTQMTKMFGHAGFKAERDVAGIVLNRWGHAFISPQPGFHFGVDGKPAPKEVVKQGFGRIRFGHSELSGYMDHTTALSEGTRAAKEAMKYL